MLSRIKYALISVIFVCSNVLTAYANLPAKPYVVVAPACLLAKVNQGYTALAKQNEFSLIKADDNLIDQLIAAKTHQKNPCGGFMNVTAAWKDFQKKNLQMKNKAQRFLSNYIPTEETEGMLKKRKKRKTREFKVQFPTQVNALISQLNPQNMWGNLTTLSSYPNRAARSNEGVKAANWIKSEVENMAKNAGREDVEVRFVETGSLKQPSVVAKIGSSTEAGVVVGGHMDTLDSFFENKPGADDDGTGSVTVLEVARALLNSDLRFKKPIYLIWYAAEELGLIGSQHVVADFKQKNIPVDAVMQLDMTGYAYKNDPTIWLIDDDVDKNLTSFLEELVNAYVKQPVKHTKCGYACSDHATWHQKGYASSMPFEAEFGNDDPYIHTARDTMNVLSLNHMSDFAKLAAAFAVELAEPVN